MAPPVYPNPNTIHLGGPIQKENYYTAGAVITPGDDIERYTDGADGAQKWRRKTSATEAEPVIIALEKFNRPITEDYAVGDQVNAGFPGHGSELYCWIETGQDIQNGEKLQSNGANGTFKSAAVTTLAANTVRGRSMEAPGLVAAKTRCRVEFLVY